MKKKYALLIFAVMLFICSLAFAEWYGGDGACRDCGSVINCQSGNGFATGYTWCWLDELGGEYYNCHVNTWGCKGTPSQE
jgi:hypothetical protein